jgi:ribosomal protein L37AE/L43A
MNEATCPCCGAKSPRPILPGWHRCEWCDTQFLTGTQVPQGSPERESVSAPVARPSRA